MDSWWDPSALKARMASMIDAINVGQEVAEIAEFSMLLTESLRKAIIEGEQESVLLERAGNFQKDFLDCYPSDQDTQKKSLNRFPECFALLRGLLNFIGEHRLENQIDLQSTLRADLSSVTTSFVRERFQTAFREQVWKKYDGLKFDSLFPGYPPGQSGKQITPDLLIRWVQDLRFALNQPLGRERLFFPVVEIASKVKEVKKTQEKESVDSKAWIVAAEITAFPCKSLIEWKILDRVLLAPWTFFSLDQSTLDSLNEALPPALDAAVDAVRRSMPSPAVTSGDTSDCRILINLQPIGAEEFKSSSTTETGRIKEQNRLFRQFCPPGTMIKGESLGLALSVAEYGP